MAASVSASVLAVASSSPRFEPGAAQRGPDTRACRERWEERRARKEEEEEGGRGGE
jgi:hypothetical protein